MLPIATTYAADYQEWRDRFLARRLRLCGYLGLACVTTFVVRDIYLLQHGQGTVIQGVLDGSIFLGMLICTSLAHLRRFYPYLGLIFLGMSWSITFVEPLGTLAQGTLAVDLTVLSLTFMAQATLMPLRWRWHLLSQVGVLGCYLVCLVILARQGLARSPVSLTEGLYLLWFCFACDLSVALHERLQKAEFHARRSLESAEVALRQSLDQLQIEQAKSERLLLNILPVPIVERLKQEEQTIADSFAEVTVLFADIVGFTRISLQLPPVELVTLLNDIFSRFDELTEQYGLEKIKTIGDAYMVVGGLPTVRPDHAAAVAAMALGMQQALRTFNATHTQSFELRIGINTGPVVAGVIGLRKFIYDLWGDTVNLASRMESHGVPGEIQVSEATYHQLRDDYELVRRGTIQVKGRGSMTTYFLRGKRLGAPPEK